jgi:lipopolysaccharide export system permease protein
MNLTQIDRYMFRQLLTALVLVTAGLTALIWLTQSLRFVELVVNRGLSLTVFLRLTGLLIPGFVAVILPITSYVVVQFVYQRLSADRELTVMRAAGLSPWRLARPALGLAGMCMLACFALNIVIVPTSATRFREFQFEIRNRIIAFLLQEGVFTQMDDDLTVYIRARDNDATLHGVMVDDARDKAHHATIFAESGRLLEGPSGPRVLLVNGSREELDAQTGRLVVLTFKENTLDLAQANKGEQVRIRDIGEMTLTELLWPTGLPPREALRMRVEANKRLAGPLNCLSFAMVGLLGVLGGGFRRHGGMLRQLTAILTVVGLVAIGLAIDSLAVRDDAFIPLIWLRATLPGLVCAVILFVPFGAARQPAPA